MGDYDCLSPIKGYADQVNEQAGFLEHRDADQSDTGCLHRHHHPAQLSETGLEPAGTAASAMGNESEYPTIGLFRHSGGVTFGNENIICLFKGIFKRILINSDFYRTAILIVILIMLCEYPASSSQLSIFSFESDTLSNDNIPANSFLRKFFALLSFVDEAVE